MPFCWGVCAEVLVWRISLPCKFAFPSLHSLENSDSIRGGGADLTKIQPAGIRTKSGGARSIEDGKGPAGSGLSLGVAGVENGGRKDATFLRPPW